MSASATMATVHDDAAIAAFAAQVRGGVIRRGEAGYEDARVSTWPAASGDPTQHG